jgi:phosphomannomutase
MNLAVVRRTTAGVADWLARTGVAGRGVVVGHDARRRSREFAHDAAATLSARGIQVHLAAAAWPTPFTAYAVRTLGAGAGVQITASHNPAGDNGYKVYDASGAQIVAPDDERIADAIDRQPAAADIATIPMEPTLGRDVAEQYEAMALGVIRAPRPAARSSTERGGLRIVYTALHGVAGEHVLRLLERAGFQDVHPVAEQLAPNATFPGLPFPNPEEPGVLDAAYALASARDAHVIAANDPDGDRLAVAVPVPHGGWRMLSGDELGVLLGVACIRGTTGAIVARSVVSARWLDRVVAPYGATTRVTLTGFKWLARAGDADGRALTYAYEEALGYAVTPEVRDKDGITALLCIAGVAADARSRGKTLLDLLAEIAIDHGVVATRQWAPRFDGPQAMETMEQAIARLLVNPPAEFAGGARTALVDHRTGAGGLPPSPLVEIEFGDSRILVRPSGTEPKLKCYFEVHGPLPPGDVAAAAYESARADLLAACERAQTELAASLGLAT